MTETKKLLSEAITFGLEQALNIVIEAQSLEHAQATLETLIEKRK